MTRTPMWILVAVTALGACSSSAGSESASDATKSSTTTTTVAESTNTAATFCEQFQALAEQREEKGGGNVQPGSTEAVPEGAAGWEQRIQTTQALADAAPAEYQDAAQTYVSLVEARAELFAEHDYPSTLAEIPSEASQAFIQDHITDQQTSNEFIQFAKAFCTR